jgi:hypothetical protein
MPDRSPRNTGNFIFFSAEIMKKNLTFFWGSTSAKPPPVWHSEVSLPLTFRVPLSHNKEGSHLPETALTCRNGSIPQIAIVTFSLPGDYPDYARPPWGTGGASGGLRIIRDRFSAEIKLSPAGIRQQSNHLHSFTLAEGLSH